MGYSLHLFFKLYVYILSQRQRSVHVTIVVFHTVLNTAFLGKDLTMLDKYVHILPNYQVSTQGISNIQKL